MTSFQRQDTLSNLNRRQEKLPKTWKWAQQVTGCLSVASWGLTRGTSPIICLGWVGTPDWLWLIKVILLFCRQMRYNWFPPCKKTTPNHIFHCPVGYCFCISLQIHFSLSIFQILLWTRLNILLASPLVNEVNKTSDTCLFYTCLCHDFNSLKSILYHAHRDFYSP